MKKLISFVLLAILGISITSFVPNMITAKALNFYSKELVTLSAGEVKTYEITIPDNKFYAIETTQFASQNLDTRLYVDLDSEIMEDDDSGQDYFSFIGFNNRGGKTIQISVSLYSNNASGSFYLQIRKQQAVYYGWEYDDINTLKDLSTPYSAFSNLYDSYKYENEAMSHFTQDDIIRGKRYNSEIMFFSGHGDKEHGLVMRAKNGSLDLTELGDMRNVRLAVWSACGSSNTDNGYGASFTHKSVVNGAKTAIGYPGNAVVTSARSFTNDLFTKLAQGETVRSAAIYAAGRLIWPFDGVKKYNLVGDTDTILTTPNYSKRDDIVIITTNNLINEALTNNYNDLVNNHNYVCIQDGNVDRYYLTINGVLSNQFVDFNKTKSNDVYLEQNYSVDGQISVLPILLKYDLNNTATEEKHLVYVVENNVATPVLIVYVDITDSEGFTYTEAKCRNLNDGSFIDYESISTVRKEGVLSVK